MKTVVSRMLTVVAFLSAALSAKPPAGYDLVWSDEFNSTMLDTSNWNCVTGVGDPVGWSSKIWQYYTDKNITVSNGACTIEARKETTSGPWSSAGSYTSGRMNSYNKRAFKYGYFEVRLKAPKGDGIWPSFWTLGEKLYDKNIGWPGCGEMEMYEQRPGTWKVKEGVVGDNYFIGTCHFLGPTGTSYNSKGVAYREALGDAYHTYAILWDSSFVEYYFDDSVYWDRTSTPNINQPSNFIAFHNPHFFIANIDILGNYVMAVTTLGPNTLPAQMSIDYIRVYQKKPTAVRGGTRSSGRPETAFFDPASTRLKIYSLRGSLVADLTNRIVKMSPGSDPFGAIGAALPAGGYVAVLFDGTRLTSRKISVTR
jgi:beta-glucanase (GH16 family)